MSSKKKSPSARNAVSTPLPWHPAWALGLGLLILVSAGIRFAEPLPDGDLWWHLAYARYMIENGTLIPDHTVFSWTPSEGGNIKVDWLSELILYGLYQLGGLSLMFVLRYVSLALFAGIFLFFAARWGLLKHPLSWLVGFMGILMAYTGTAPKPELFSYMLLVLVAGTWFWIRESADLGWRYCYLFPVWILFWANSHAGVQVGMTLLALIGLGELLSFWVGTDRALSKRVVTHLVAALVLCGVAVFITPYGWDYPLSLVNKLTSRDYAELRTVHAFLSIFDERADTLPFEEYLLVVIPLLVLVFWKQWGWRQLDWALILTNLFFGWFYVQFIRSTYYWGPIFALSALCLLGRQSAPLLWPTTRARQLWLGVAVLLASGWLGYMSVYDSVCRVSLFRYAGFGHSYANAVEESRFIQEHLSGYRFGNSYDAGGYMLWLMWPERKVFIDPRYFPYKSWYADYLEFINGRETAALVDRFPADVWYVRYHDPPAIDWFLSSPEWKLAYYGSSGAVFVRPVVPLPEGSPIRSAEIDRVRNHFQAVQILLFESKYMNFAAAEKTVTMMEECFYCPEEVSLTAMARDFLTGMQFFHQHDFEGAAEYLDKARKGGKIYNQLALTQAYHHLAAAAWERNAHQQGLELAEKSLTVRPNSLHGLYNAGIAEWYLHQVFSTSGPGVAPVGVTGRSGKWRQRLELFLRLSAGAVHIPEDVRQLAQSILAGTYTGRPPMLAPTIPKLPPEQGTGSRREAPGPDPA